MRKAMRIEKSDFCNPDEKIKYLEQIMLKAAMKSKKPVACNEQKVYTEDQNKLKELRNERKKLTTQTNLTKKEKDNQRSSICKEMQKLQRRVLRIRKHEKINDKLKNFKGLKQIPIIKNARKIRQN